MKFAQLQMPVRLSPNGLRIPARKQLRMKVRVESLISYAHALYLAKGHIFQFDDQASDYAV